MGQRHSPSTIAALRHIEKNGSANYLDIDLIVTGAYGRICISTLKKGGYIEALPKERCQLKRYAITDAGRKLIQIEIIEKTQRMTSFTMPVWVPPAWKLARAGAADALQIKSRGV